MKNVKLIALRELGAYFRSMSGYVIASIFLLSVGILFHAMAMGESERRSAEVLYNFFFFTSGATMICSLVLSMRLLAEEKQTGTIALLASSPVRDREIILGKYIGALVFLWLMILATLYVPLMILVNGKISWGHLAAGYMGLMLLGGSTLAIGTFGSAIGKNQVLAIIISAVLVSVLLMAWMLARVTERPFSEFFLSIALFHKHFTPFGRGVIHLRDIVYYLGLIYFSLFAATRVLEARRWR
ncbi:MAG: ABC transporter permease subunit [Deltaproteobacteria bacterium]|nr:ABC transporter permease subunit [Deltaproteobacteria bacterium]